MYLLLKLWITKFPEYAEIHFGFVSKFGAHYGPPVVTGAHGGPRRSSGDIIVTKGFACHAQHAFRNTSATLTG